MNHLRHAIRSNSTLPTFNPNHRLPLFLRQSPKHFSTEAEQPPPQQKPPPRQNPSIDPFLEDPKTGLLYAKLFGITKHTFKTDIIHMLEGCNLTTDDIKVNYARNYLPLTMMIQFPSREAFDNAVKTIWRKGRIYRLERVNRAEWDMLMPYDGKTVLMQGFSRNAIPEDVERFLSGCEYVPSSIQMFLRQGFQRNPIRMALVRFSSRIEAMNALITKNKGFCLNNQILLRVLE